MGITRKLPNTDDGRNDAINTATAELAAVAAPDVTLTAATQARLAAIKTSFNTAMTDKGVKLADQSAATTSKDASQAVAKMFVSHWFQVFNMGIERGVYTASQRGYFGLDINDDRVPDLSSEADIIKWGDKIATGDPLRVAAGGVAMSNPTTVQVNAQVSAFVTSNTAQGLKITAYENALAAVAALRTEADAVILKVWDETETFYNELSPAAKRNKCRPWGLIYVSDTIFTINVKVVKQATGEPLVDADVFLVQGDTHHSTDALGNVTIKTTVADLATLKTNVSTYAENTTEVTLDSGTLVYDVVIKMIP